MEEVISKSQNNYEAIFARVNQKNINGWMSARVFEFLPLEKRPKIYLLLSPEEETRETRNYFLTQGADDIFDIPLSMHELKRIKKIY